MMNLLVMIDVYVEPFVDDESTAYKYYVSSQSVSNMK
jgi:hypothetical protein